MMFSYLTVQILAYSILLPAAIGLARFRKMLPAFRPFVWLIWLGLFNEALSTILQAYIHSNTVNSNIYVLAEGLLLLYVFYYWNFRTRSSANWYLATGIMFCAIWLVDNLVLHPLTRFNSIYRITYSLVVVYLSVNQINQMIIEERDSLVKHPLFIICVSFLLFYSYRMVFEVFYIYDFGFTPEFYNRLFDILVVANLASNLLYAIALLWVPMKQRFILPY